MTRNQFAPTGLEASVRGCMGHAHRLWGRAVQWFLDRHPTFSERFLCYWVGGIEELQVTLEAVKTPPANALPRG